jgi:hypothetical protein
LITLTSDTPILFVTVLYTVRMFGITMVTMPVTTAGMNALPSHLISHGTAVNNTVRQVAASIGTAILVSVLATVTNANTPAHTLKITTPIAYARHLQAATVAGYRAAFVVSLLLCVLGFALSLRLSNDPLDGGAHA